MGFLALDKAFTELHLRKISGETLLFNTRAIKFHQKLGFTQEGTLVAHVIKNGVPVDVVCFALFDHQWKATRAELERHIFAKGLTVS
jgi:UDP-4-amino-4,6-dideoxy-N-acetyl-beta-L-altrosamine N-acetyltransferase